MLQKSLNPFHTPLPSKPLTKTPSSFPLPNYPFLLYPLIARPTFPLIRATSLPDPQTLPHSAIQRIADKLRSLGFTAPTPQPTPGCPPSAGEIFIPLPNQLPKYRVGHTLDPSWSTPENPVPLPGAGNAIVRHHELMVEAKEERQRWLREEKEERRGRGRVPTVAELKLGASEVRRLRRVGIGERRKLKVGKAGITEGIVNGIHERWRRTEVVKIVCEDLCRMNMKRTHDLLERKTGGLVIWRSGSKIILYRGTDYQYPYFSSDTVSETSSGAAQMECEDNEGIKEVGSSSWKLDGVKSSGPSPIDQMIRSPLIQGVGSPNRVRFQLPGEAQLAEEADQLLEELGPRFTDWWGYDPLPVDADLLPAVIPGYRRPFRLLPYGMKPILTNDEMTTLRRLGRPLPCHFALGRNKKLQGLAASIVKLWEKCEIAKIAVKRGVQNTNSEMMAEELKWLTGGTLLSRDREFIVLYRGKDFLPSAVSSAVEERRKHGLRGNKQLVENSASGKIFDLKDETKQCDSRDELNHCYDQRHIMSDRKKLNTTEAAIKRTSIKLSMALEKKAKAEKLLMDLEKAEVPQQPAVDKEGITEEERYMLRKVGLKMHAFLLMGRRGVFDGTIENMHLHWKYRELVKVICKERSFEAVYNVARTLESESGGILVAVERVSKGFAIIVYRGKNYRRPPHLRPPTLLSKREAMKRSLEAQRRKSLKLHVLKLSRNIDNLKLQLAKDKVACDRQSFDDSSIQTRDKDDTIPINLNDGQEAWRKSVEPAQQASQSNISLVVDGNETSKSEPETSSESVAKETHEIQFGDTNDGAVGSASCPDNYTASLSEERSLSPFLHDKNCASDNEEVGSRVTSAEHELGKLVKEEEEDDTCSRAVQLSNRDRLLLRKQALKMTNRPVLAVGRSNVVTGVAKTIKAHFQKYPLAVVNVKGRAKGTSVQEVVSKLEQATGAIFVSQEPSKVILYRGWGAELEPGHRSKKNARYARNASVDREVRVQQAVSPELIAAIRLECGLENKHEKGKTSTDEI